MIFHVGDWVTDGHQLARVRYVGRTPADNTFDLVMYSIPNGDRLGRVSPAMGGPRHFEPCCDTKGWRRCKPSFPIRLVRRESGIVEWDL
jgi:hypothetical protein